MKPFGKNELKIREDLRDDFEHYASTCLWIRAKNGEKKRLVLNEAQLYIHQQLEKQKQETGRVRALVLKGRQQGCSTYVEARFYHIASWSFGIRVFIFTHEDEATKNIFEMAKRYHDNCPEVVRPSTKASNAKEILFDKLDTGYRVATAGTKGVGRSATFQLFHGSEVAIWPNAAEHARGAMEAVPGVNGTEIILESTSAGPKGYFYQKWTEAVLGLNDFIPIFVPWFWQSEYRAEPVDNLSAEEQTYKAEYGLDDEQIAWRRNKINNFRAEGQPGVYAFRREYPATPKEAFNAEVPGALWERDVIESTRVSYMPMVRSGALSLDPATTSEITSDEWGSISGVIGSDGHLYVYADDTLRASPKVNATNAINRVLSDSLDFIIYETNQGGDMVPTIIHEINPRVLCVGVTASKGKRARAEPIALMYEQGRIHHVGELPLLEDEMCTWKSNSNESPNRIDALVWLATYLLLKNQPMALMNSDTLSRESPNILI